MPLPDVVSGLLLSVGSEVQILSGTPESTAASLFSGVAAFFVPPSPGNFTSVTGRFLYAASFFCDGVGFGKDALFTIWRWIIPRRVWYNINHTENAGADAHHRPVNLAAAAMCRGRTMSPLHSRRRKAALHLL